MKIFFTKRADKNFHLIRDRIFVEYGGKVAEAFELKTINFLDILENFPELGSLEVKEKQIRGFQLTKQTRVFYRIKGEIIVILTFFDVRQDPKKKPGT